jgi:hypothetical protein
VVTGAMLRARARGASSTGCLLWLLVFVGALYYGVNVGEVYFRYYRLLDEMDSQARIASGLDNGTIARRIAAAVQEIGIPDSAARVVVRRNLSPREITITTDYSETVNLPFFKHTFAFHPKATQPL